MRKYIYIMVGGMLGAVLRFTIKNIHILNVQESFPLNTLLTNITGSFILALFLTVAFEVSDFDADIRLGIATGFLGAYTTFSTLCKEIVVLIISGKTFLAIIYMILSVTLGLAAAYFGNVLARVTISKLVRDTKIIDEGEFK